MSTGENVKQVRTRIEQACRRAGRSIDEVKLVAVSKTVSVERISQAIAAGITVLGENRVQEAWQKFEVIGDEVVWHLVGHLQTNKVRRALQFVELIHSVDSIHLAMELQKQAEKLEREVDILVQVNTSNEETKFGLAPDSVLPVVQEISRLQRVHILGLMTIGAFTSDVSVVRGCFRSLRKLRDDISRENLAGVSMNELSMGMTNDFELAIEEGATMVRIGRSIFGERISA